MVSLKTLPNDPRVCGKSGPPEFVRDGSVVTAQTHKFNRVLLQNTSARCAEKFTRVESVLTPGGQDKKAGPRAFDRSADNLGRAARYKRGRVFCSVWCTRWESAPGLEPAGRPAKTASLSLFAVYFAFQDHTVGCYCFGVGPGTLEPSYLDLPKSLDSTDITALPMEIHGNGSTGVK
ncbi:hypothetical protein Bbelb_306880 [Branchiostoma belcheri]|nr:hypothetical protein Bbelb_306880 [Branchiostoma belcheri]